MSSPHTTGAGPCSIAQERPRWARVSKPGPIDATLREHGAPEKPQFGVALVLYHRDGAKVAPLVQGGAVVVGRAYPADLVIDDPGLSRRHARFAWGDDGVTVEDLGSTNGTRKNGEPVARAPLAQGDEVTLGGVTVAVQVRAPRDGELRGLDSHDRFLASLEEEVTRARTFGRQLAVLMVRAAVRDGGHLSRWIHRVRPHLRPVDHLALYGPDSVLLSLPEVDDAQAGALAQAIVAGRAEGEPVLRTGVAVFPEAGATAEALIEAVRTAALARQLPTRPPTLVEAEKSPRGAAMREVHEVMVPRLAKSTIPVLILGETGSGKEVVTRAIHDASPRRGKPLRCINCAAIPASLIESVLFGHEKGAFTSADRAQKGIFEQAHGGTVLLDEVGELQPAAQAALLRVLETKKVTRIGSDQEIEVDVRVIAATHRDLEAMCDAGQFRWDLLYRLNTMTLRIPPLRERPEEIRPLAELFLAEAGRATGCAVRAIEPQALALLQAYRWPGNVRELRNVIERAVVIAQGPAITALDLSERVRQAAAPGGAAADPAAPAGGQADGDGDYKERVRRYEVELIVDALRRAQGNQTEAARALKMPLRTLVHKIQTYGIKKKYGVE